MKITTCWPAYTYFPALKCRFLLSLSPPCTSFLSLMHFFYPWIKSVPPLFRFCFLLLLGTFVETMRPRAPVSSRLTPPAGKTCASWCFPSEGLHMLRGGRRLQLNSPTLCHPLLPAPWWVVASWAHCLHAADKCWKFEGTFQSSSPLSDEKKKLNLWHFVTSEFSSQKSQMVSQKGTSVSGSDYYLGNVSNFYQEVSFTGNPSVILLKLVKIKDVFWSFIEFFFPRANKNQKGIELATLMP